MAELPPIPSTLRIPLQRGCGADNYSHSLRLMTVTRKNTLQVIPVYGLYLLELRD